MGSEVEGPIETRGGITNYPTTEYALRHDRLVCIVRINIQVRLIGINQYVVFTLSFMIVML